MYLHLGGDVAVRIKDIVAIMDMETTSTSKKTREFLKITQKNGEIISVNNELPKSYVIITQDKRTKVYISPISSQTLLKRANNFKEYFNILNR